jgi:hypothetical protein
MHLGLWDICNHDPPQLDDTHTPTIEIDTQAPNRHPQRRAKQFFVFRR